MGRLRAVSQLDSYSAARAGAGAASREDARKIRDVIRRWEREAEGRTEGEAASPEERKQTRAALAATGLVRLRKVQRPKSDE